MKICVVQGVFESQKIPKKSWKSPQNFNYFYVDIPENLKVFTKFSQNSIKNSELAFSYIF
jgi:hypothetical protein